jgi:peptidoglycan/LPS O-acetylase OafA/YrhL
MVQGWVDTMMVGCTLALLKGEPRWERIHRRFIHGWSAAAMAVIGFLVAPVLLIVLPKFLSSLFGLVLKPFLLAACIGGILVYVVENSESLAGRILNASLVRHIGVMSYSLYLWQQLFTSYLLPMLPIGLFYAFAAAEFSYWVVERPSLSLRARLERKQNASPITQTT